MAFSARETERGCRASLDSTRGQHCSVALLQSFGASRCKRAVCVRQRRKQLVLAAIGRVAREARYLSGELPVESFYSGVPRFCLSGFRFACVKARFAQVAADDSSYRQGHGKIQRDIPKLRWNRPRPRAYYLAVIAMLYDEEPHAPMRALRSIELCNEAYLHNPDTYTIDSRSNGLTWAVL